MSSTLTTGNVLVVDDDDSIRRALRRELSRSGFNIQEAASGEAAFNVLASEEVEVVLLDIRLPGLSGIELLPEILARWPHLAVIMLTGHGDVDSAVACMRAGAQDFLQKPCHLGELEAALSRAVEKVRLAEQKRDLAARLTEETAGANTDLVGGSEALGQVRAMIARVAPTDVSVILTGESGTGKEVVARQIVAQSRRAHAPYLTINCGALSETLLESELFGHERGAFTGASERRIGFFEHAGGGTVFLDEVSEMPPAMQAKLLRLLQFGEYFRVGSTEVRRTDVRIIAATNRDLAEEVRGGRFREDLLYRLNTVTIAIPPLRERMEDLPALCQHILGSRLADVGRPVSISAQALEHLQSHGWPGNVRELENVLRSAAIMADGGVIEPGHLPAHLRHAEPAGTPSLDEVERRHILAVLEQCGGNKAETARRLGITKKTLYSKLVVYGRHTRGDG
ncbi:MAG: sigma-54-dependent Fis family transcriptional regulator [Candidatus Sumerlaeia bacterium]|nr:sigma-54-dependent Fis family transcriptional regulator [Candidatus Sumerlaeia bacterium]